MKVIGDWNKKQKQQQKKKTVDKRGEEKKCYNQTKLISYMGDLYLLCTMSFLMCSNCQ